MKMKNDGVDLFPLPASVSGVLAACGLLLLGLPVMAATIPVIASSDATVYDLAPADGVADQIESWQFGLESGVAYDYYRDGRVAKAVLWFDLSPLTGRAISSASFYATVWSYRIGSSFDVFGFEAGPSLVLGDWDSPALFAGRSGDVHNHAARVPFEFNVTSLLQSAIGSGWNYLGIRLQDGGSQVTDPHVGFIGVGWPPDVNITHPYNYPRLSVDVADVPEPGSLFMIFAGFSFFAAARRRFPFGRIAPRFVAQERPQTGGSFR